MAGQKNNRGQKLNYYLSRLSSREKRQFQKFLESPLLGNSIQGGQILEILEEKAGSRPILPEWFSEIMIPDEPMSPKKVHYIWVRLSVFQEKLMEFLSFLEYKNDKASQNRYLLQSCRDRGWEKYLESIYQKGMRESAQPLGAETLSQQLGLEIILNEYLSDHGVAGTDTHLEAVLDKLDAYFVVEKLKYACAAENARLMWGIAPKPILLDPVIQLIPEAGFGQIPVVKAYFHGLMMLRSSPNAGTHFAALAELLADVKKLTHTEANDLFVYAQNFCVLQIRRKDTSYLSILKNLYDGMLNSDRLLDRGMISPTFYKNAVTLMCRFGEFAWAEQFTESYQARLSKQIEPMAYLYNLSVLHFHQGNFQQVVKLLYPRMHLFDNVAYGIGARIYLCKSLWEQQEWNWLAQKLDSFKQYLYRNRALLPEDKRRHGKFVHRLRQILREHTGDPDRRRGRLQDIEDSMTAEGELNLYPWLKELLEKELQASVQ